MKCAIQPPWLKFSSCQVRRAGAVCRDIENVGQKYSGGIFAPLALSTLVTRAYRMGSIPDERLKVSAEKIATGADYGSLVGHSVGDALVEGIAGERSQRDHATLRRVDESVSDARSIVGLTND